MLIDLAKQFHVNKRVADVTWVMFGHCSVGIGKSDTVAQSVQFFTRAVSLTFALYVSPFGRRYVCSTPSGHRALPLDLASGKLLISLRVMDRMSPRRGESHFSYQVTFDDERKGHGKNGA